MTDLVVKRTSVPHSAEIVISDSEPYLSLCQDDDEIVVTEEQLQWLLDAITQVAKAMRWKEYL